MWPRSLGFVLPFVIACGGAAAPLPVPPVTTAPPLPAPPPPPSMELAATGIEPTWMDPTVDACQDFYAYACQGFQKSAEIPADRPSWGTPYLVEKKNETFLRETLDQAAKSPGDSAVGKRIGDYYAACTDEDAIEKAGVTPIAPLLALAGGVRDAASLASAIVKLHATHVFPLWDVSSQQDYKDASLVIAGLDQNGLGLPDRDYYLKDDGNLKSVREFYAGHVGRMLGLAGLAKGEQKAAVDDVMRLETKLAKIQQDKVSRRDPYKVYHRVDRTGLPGLMKTFPWETYFQELGIPAAQAVSVNDPAYYTGLDALMREEKPSAWRHYLGWQVVRSRAALLGKKLLEEQFALRAKLAGQKEMDPRWKRCVHAVDRDLGELLAQPYVEARFGGDSKARAQAVVEQIIEAMRADLKALPWMDEPTRTAALAKLEKIRHEKVGYPDKFRTYDFDVSRASYAANVMAAQKFEQHRQLAKIGKPVDRTEWMMTPPTVNAYYDPSLNEFVLPAGQLQPPFFARDFYPPVNLGETGAGTVGHELTHGFDDEGSQFDGDGNLREWWSKDTRARFVEATRCVQDQYSQYDAVPGVKLNGALTSGENIADIGGVKLGLAALKSWQAAHPEERRTVEGFSDEQLYFLSYAQSWCMKETPEMAELHAHSDPHSPPRWRVNGPVADVPGFADAFHCKAGTPMSPAGGANGKVCAVW